MVTIKIPAKDLWLQTVQPTICKIDCLVTMMEDRMEWMALIWPESGIKMIWLTYHINKLKYIIVWCYMFKSTVGTRILIFGKKIIWQSLPIIHHIAIVAFVSIEQLGWHISVQCHKGCCCFGAALTMWREQRQNEFN